MGDGQLGAYITALRSGEQALYEGFVSRVEHCRCAQFLFPHDAQWRALFTAVGEGLADYLEENFTMDGDILESLMDKVFDNVAGELGVEWSQTFRGRALPFSGFFVVLQCMRTPFGEHVLDFVISHPSMRPLASACSMFFDRLESGAAAHWHREDTIYFQRKLREAKHFILNEKRRYSTIFYKMAEPAFVVDQSMHLIDVNNAFEKFFKVDSDKLIGKSCCFLLGKDACEACLLSKALHEHTSFSNIEVVVPVLGEERIVLMSGSSLGFVHSEFSGGIVILQDITEQKRTLAKLAEYRAWLEELVEERTRELRLVNEQLLLEVAERQQTQRELEVLAEHLQRSNAELEQFAHVASHDMKEPLMLIVAFTERLMAKCGEQISDKGREYMERILKAAKQLQALVDDILELSRVRTSGRPFGPVDLNVIVREAMGDLEETTRQAAGRIEVEELMSIDGDSVQLRQLFQNLLGNALKYSKKGVPPSIEVRTRELPGEICEITVQDNGIGFDENDLTRIFQPFVRLHSKHDYEGTGIGLSTCEKIVTRHGGIITAKSRPDQGTVFIIRLPCKQQQIL